MPDKLTRYATKALLVSYQSKLSPVFEACPQVTLFFRAARVINMLPVNKSAPAISTNIRPAGT